MILPILARLLGCDTASPRACRVIFRPDCCATSVLIAARKSRAPPSICVGRPKRPRIIRHSSTG